MAHGSALPIFEPVLPRIWADPDGYALSGKTSKTRWYVLDTTHPEKAQFAADAKTAFNIGRKIVGGGRRIARRKKHMAELNLALADAAPMKRARDVLDDLQDVARMADNARMQEVFAKTKHFPRFKRLSRGLVAMVLGR